MVRIDELSFFMNGNELTEDDGISVRALMGFIKRLVLDFLEYNTKSDHECNEHCLEAHGIVIGGPPSWQRGQGDFIDCVPK